VVKPQVDVQRRWASLGLWPWHWHRDLAWPACPTTLLDMAALGIAARSMAALSAPSVVSACRWRPLDLAGARGGEAAPQIMSELGRCVSMHVIELIECGARTTPVDLVLSHLAEEDEMRPLQGLATQVGSMTRSSGARRSTTATFEVSCSGSGAFCSCRGRHSSGGRAERGWSLPSLSPRAITSTMVPKSQLSPQLEPPSLRGLRTSVTSSGKGLAM
jgi:hypothetical protein